MAISKPSGLSFRKAKSAFSLVEVVMAIGVVAFGFISVFGMIPTGLNTFRRAMDTSVGSQIAQRAINDAQQTDFSALVQNTTASKRYFDEQGNEQIALQDDMVPASAVYQVRTVIQSSMVTPYSTSNQPAEAKNDNLARVIVQIVNSPSKQTPSLDPVTNLWNDARFPIATHSAIISRSK